MRKSLFETMRDRQLRIFHLIKGVGRGGAEMLLSKGLAYGDRQRFNYGYGYFLPWKDALVPELRRQGAEVFCFETRRAPGFALAAARVARFLRAWRADLLHCHLPVAGVVGRLAGRLAGVPVVYTEHNVMERYHPLTRRSNCWTWPLQEAAVAVSGDVADSIRRHVGERVPLHIVRNGVDVEHFGLEEERRQASQLRASLGIPENAPIIGTVAVFRPQKRLDLWLESAALIRRQAPATHFLLVGDGPQRAELEARARELDLAGVTHFVGLREDVRPYLAAMDVYLMSSQFEGLPVALLEAMASRLPVVATAVGGIVEAIDHESTGLLVPFGDASDLASACLRLLRNESEREALGMNARQSIESRFGMRRMAGELEAIYTAVLEKRNAG